MVSRVSSGSLKMGGSALPPTQALGESSFVSMVWYGVAFARKEHVLRLQAGSPDAVTSQQPSRDGEWSPTSGTSG